MNHHLEDIQAGILKAHGRKHTRFIFVQLLEEIDKDLIYQSLGQSIFPSNKPFTIVSNALKQLEEHKIYNNSEDVNNLPSQESIITTVHFSATGLKKINRLDWMIKEDQFFKRGMKSPYSLNKLCDLPVEEWETQYQSDIDLMFTISGNSVQKLDAYEAFICEKLANIQQSIFTEKGTKLMRDGYAIEPFGFKDNITNPCFFDKIETPTNRIDYKMLADQFFIALDERGGSYLSFRKLEQDVEAFNQKAARLAQELGITIDYAEAQMVGRFKDGTPLVLGDTPDEVNQELVEKFDRFDQIGYRVDAPGIKCPFHAHIRRANPREDRTEIWDKSYAKRLKIISDEVKIAQLEHTKKLFGRIIRRGVPYVEKEKTGLLFLAYQASISDQFVVVQKGWCNEPNLKYNGLDIGLDPIVGQYDRDFRPQYLNKWHTKWNGQPEEAKVVDISFKDLVTLKGGEFLYAPSIKDLKQEIDLAFE